MPRSSKLTKDVIAVIEEVMIGTDNGGADFAVGEFVSVAKSQCCQI